MKPQEVINIIEDVTWNDNGRHYGKINTAREMAISAIEKQIPQKPIIEREDFPEINSFCETYRCPICSLLLVERDRVGFTNDLRKYCDCGQAIDYQF